MRILSPIFQALLVILAASTITFLVQSAVPGNPAADYIGPSPGLSQEQRAVAIKHEEIKLGLDKPLPVRYVIWLGHAVRGDFGSDVNGQNVRSSVGERIGPSLELAVTATLLSLPMAIMLAIAVVRRRNGWLWRVWNGVAIVGLVLPPFWLGLLLVLAFAVWQRWLPASGYVSFSSDPARHVEHLILPVMTLVASQVAVYYRYLQQSLRTAMESAFVRTARAKGVSERRIMYRHALPNALLPTFTMLGVQFGALIGTVVVVERIFNWPGVGTLLVGAVENGSYNTVTFTVLAFTVVYVISSALIDVAHRISDPRIRRA